MALQVSEAEKNARSDAHEFADEDLLEETSELYDHIDNIQADLDQKKSDLQEALQTITKLTDQQSRKRPKSPEPVPITPVSSKRR